MSKPKVNQAPKPRPFKARKMPDMSLPYMIFKNEKKLTVFEEFDLSSNKIDYSFRINETNEEDDSKFRKTMIDSENHVKKVISIL